MVRLSDTTSAQASFVAGNVFFEILFSDKGDVEWANYYYFSLACATMVLGGLVVVLSQAINVAIVNLPSEAAKTAFGLQVDPAEAMFVLFNSCQYVWLLSLVGLGYTKYVHQWQYSFVWGLAGLATLSFLWFGIRALWMQAAARRPVSTRAVTSAGPLRRSAASSEDEGTNSVSEMVPLSARADDAGN